MNAASRTAAPDKRSSIPVAPLELAAELGAAAVGWTFFYGSPNHYENQEVLGNFAYKAHALGLPVIVWCYPRGPYMDEFGGPDSLANITDAALLAKELGADVVKVSFPHPMNAEWRDSYLQGLAKKRGIKIEDNNPEYAALRYAFMKNIGQFSEFELDAEQSLGWLVRMLAPLGVIVAGGPKVDDPNEKTAAIYRAGAAGPIVGRNVFVNLPSDAVQVLAHEVERFTPKRYDERVNGRIEEITEAVTNACVYLP